MFLRSVPANTARTAIAIGILALAAPCTATADLTIDWWTVDDGGKMLTTGGSLELSGTIGQLDAGAPMTGGDLELTGGFWVVAGFSEPEPCPGDLDGDLDIDLSDLATLLANYGVTSGAVYGDGDLDEDGDVDLSDLATLLAVYGTTCE